MDPNTSTQPIQPITLETQTPAMQTVPKSPNTSSNKTKYILLGLLILLIVAVVGGIYYLGFVRQQHVSQKNNNVAKANPTPYPTPFAGKTFVDDAMGIEVTYGSYPYDSLKILSVRKTTANIFRFVAQTPDHSGIDINQVTGINETQLAILTVGKHTNLSNYKTCDVNMTAPCIANGLPLMLRLNPYQEKN